MSRGKMLWGIKLFDGPDKLYADITHLHHDEGGGGGGGGLQKLPAAKCIALY